MKLTTLKLPKLTKRQLARLRTKMKKEEHQYKLADAALSQRLRHIRQLSAMEQFDIAAQLTGNFSYGDGFAYLAYADGACHVLSGCKVKGVGNHSCHLHLGLVGSNTLCPKKWDHGQTYCAQAKTRDQAIRRALKMAGLL